MSTDDTVFETLSDVFERQGIGSAVDLLVEHFRSNRQYHELFEALKMQTRQKLGLPANARTDGQIDELTQAKLETGLLEACREVGEGLMKQNRLQEGWMYLQPLGDQAFVQQLLDSVDVDDENRDTLIEIGLTQGAAPQRGFQLVLEHYGTCNAITTLDMQGHQFDRDQQTQLAGMLVCHLHAELKDNLKRHIQELGGALPSDSNSITELLKANPSVTDDGGHHIDATHLASVMRLARNVNSRQELKLLCELAEYGCALDTDFHLAGMPPFEKGYPDYQIYYSALLEALEPGPSEDVLNRAVSHFQKKCESTDREEFGLIAVETFVDFLSRVGHSSEAIQVSISEILGQGERGGIAPSVFAIAKTESDRLKLMQFFRAQNDLLSYSIGLFDKPSDQ